MATEPQAPTAAAYWHATLAENDRTAHAAEAERAPALELEGLRLRCTELSAALVQARAAITVRHELLADQAAALAERDRALEAARAEIEQLRADYDRVVGSRRWRLSGALGGAARLPRVAAARLRGRA